MSPAQAYRVTCPDCGETIYVDEGMREPLLEEGCIVCRGRLSPADFAPV